MSRAVASLKIRRRMSPWAVILPTVRGIALLGLVLALVVGGLRWLSLPRQAGALTFTSHIIGVETGAVGVLGMAASDIDDDDDIDIITTGKDGIKVYINNDDGTFTVKIVDDTDAERVQVVDIDKDGAQDLLVTLKGVSPSIRWYRNTGNVEFTGTNIGTDSDGKAYAGDIDRDGAPDVVTATTAGDSVTLQRWMNNGTGTLTATTMGTGTGVTAVTIGDVNANGFPDIVTGGSKGVQRWDTSDGYSWSRVDIDEANTNQEQIVVADVNGDGKQDMVMAEPEGNLALLYRNVDNYAFLRGEVGEGIDAVTVVPVDLDEDGDEDIVVAAQDDNSIFWYENDGSEEFSRTTIADSLQSVFGVVVTDVDGDNDFDIIAGDHGQGNVYWYERVLARPTASVPGEITQNTSGNGEVTFKTTVSDEDRDATRLRVQYSIDGVSWYKPWLASVSADSGSVDLKNSNGYQVGTANSIDTDTNDDVRLTMVWDTKSVLNTGGPIVGDITSVQLRLIPRDGVGNGETVVSSNFQVDNAAPQLDSIRVSQIGADQVEFTWDKPTDSSSISYKLYYGTNHAAVLEQTSAVWDESDDVTMGDSETTAATVTGLSENTRYTFKMFVEDVLGNRQGVPSVRVTTGQAATEEETPAPGPEATGSPIPTEAVPSVLVTPIVSPTPVETFIPEDLPPVSNAGEDQVVNSESLVILDGTDSRDPEGGILTYTWRQLDGPVVELSSVDTATPSFISGGESEVYVFSLVVRDFSSQTSSDTVTIVTRALPEAVDVITDEEQVEEVVSEPPAFVSLLLRPIDLILFSVALLATVVSLLDRILQVVGHRRIEEAVAFLRGRQRLVHRGRVVQYKTGEPVVGVQVLIYGKDKKVKHKLYTNAHGVFSAALKPGDYTMAVKAEGFAFSPMAATFNAGEGEVVYTGGVINIASDDEGLSLVIPMKPTGETVGSLRTQALRLWQVVQRRGHLLSWPVFVVGSLLNTGLLLMAPSGQYLLLEVLYVGLVGIKVFLEVRLRPSYGLVRDAITHVPLDLAVVRLYEQGTNRLVMTRVADSSGRFFALPPPGRYTVTVTKPGYAPFSKEGVEITSVHDAKVQIKADLMPVAPQVGLARVGVA